VLIHFGYITKLNFFNLKLKKLKIKKLKKLKKLKIMNKNNNC